MNNYHQGKQVRDKDQQEDVIMGVKEQWDQESYQTQD
jgi:hypothetical protein